MAKARWLLLGLPLVLGGCFVPLPITIASLSASSVAFVTTGKTIPEHALSAATARDCSFIRVLSEDGNVCQTVEAPEIMLAGAPESEELPAITGEPNETVRDRPPFLSPNVGY